MKLPDGYVHATRLDATTVRLLRIDGARIVASRGPDGRIWVDVIRAGEPTQRIVDDPSVVASSGAARASDADPRIVASTSGVVREMHASIGRRFEAGEIVVVLEAMKMRIELRARVPCVVREVAAEVGARVERGALLVVVDPS